MRGRRFVLRFDELMPRCKDTAVHSGPDTSSPADHRATRDRE